jgi:hypothetical protein
MRKLLILTIFLSSLIMTSVANAEWTKVAENVNGSRTLHERQGLMVK